MSKMKAGEPIRLQELRPGALFFPSDRSGKRTSADVHVVLQQLGAGIRIRPLRDGAAAAMVHPDALALTAL